MKWLGVVLMTVDHVDKYLYRGKVEWMFDLGRMTLPLFCFVLAYNLARPDFVNSGAAVRTLRRLLVAGAVATVPYIGLGQVLAGWWPLNILFMLGLSVWIAIVAEGRGVGRVVGLIVGIVVGGALVEFWWPALALVFSFRRFILKPGFVSALWVTLALASLTIINRNLWAFGTLPLLLLAPKIDVQLPRARTLFYAYFPLHLLALWGLQVALQR